MTTVLVTGVADVEKALEGLDGKDRTNTLRRAVRAAAKPMQASLKRVAASSPVPRSFTKVPAAKVSTHGGAGRGISAVVRPKSPLFNILQPGAKPHEIAPRAAQFMAGPAGSGSWDSDGRKRADAFFARGPVHHPGLKSRDILGPAFSAAEAAAMDAFTAVVMGSGPTATGE